MSTGNNRPQSPANRSGFGQASGPDGVSSAGEASGRAGNLEPGAAVRGNERRPAGRSGSAAGGKAPASGNAGSKPDGKPGAKPKKRRKRRHPAVRALLWTLRAAIVPLLCIAALLAGLYIGYTKIGDGAAEDVWNLETWLHMFDLIFAES